MLCPNVSRGISFLALIGSGILPQQGIVAGKIDGTLVESAILVNLDEVTANPAHRLASSRQRRAHGELPELTVKTDIDAATTLVDVNATARWTTGTPDLAITLKTIFGGHTDVEIQDAVRHGVDYLAGRKDMLSLDLEQIGFAIESFAQAALEEATDKEAMAELLGELVMAGGTTSLIPQRANEWGLSVPEVGQVMSEHLARGAMKATDANATILRQVASGLTSAALTQIRDESNASQEGAEFIPGISGIPEINRGKEYMNQPEDMRFGGVVKDKGYWHFDPNKSKLVEYVSNGVAFGALGEARNQDLNGIEAATLARAIGSGASEGAVDFLVADSNATGDNHRLFTYEVIKYVGSGVSLGSVLVAGSVSEWSSELVAKEVAGGVAEASMTAAIEANQLIADEDATLELHRVGESAAFGTSMGAQFATVFDISMDYDFYGPSKNFDREAIARSVSAGAAEASLEVAAREAVAIQNADTNGTLIEKARQDLLQLARGTAMGSVLSNVAMAIYYETDLQGIVLASSQGSAEGSMVLGLGSIDKPRGTTEFFEVEVARAVANGASTGALFEVVGLLDSKPDIRRGDIDSIATAKSASYGATLGAILGGDEVGQDSIAIKQAVEQGATEGSIDGAALAMGIPPDETSDARLKSEGTIKNAVSVGNTDAATKAARELAVKSIKPSPADVLKLMQLYGINPRTTNPGIIFPNPKKKGEEDFLFEDKIEVASPI